MAWRRRFGIAAALFGAAFLAFLGFLFSVDNGAPISLRLLHRETAPLPVFWWLYSAFAGGLLVGFGFSLAGYLRGRFAERRLRKALREREAEISRLRDSSRGTEDATNAAASES